MHLIFLVLNPLKAIPKVLSESKKNPDSEKLRRE
jgi:hypothetical protein